MSDNSEKLKNDLEIWKAQEHRALEIWKTQVARQAAIYQNVNLLGQGALKAAILINGGASVAMLAFIGQMLNNSVNKLLLSKESNSMLLFVIGTLLAAIASGITYLAAYVDAETDDEKKETNRRFWKCWFFYNTCAIIFVIASYVLFLIGSLNAYLAFSGLLNR